MSKNLQEKIDVDSIDNQLNKKNICPDMLMSLKIGDANFELIECQNKKDLIAEIVCPANLFYTLKESVSSKKEVLCYIAGNCMFTFSAEDMIFESFKKIDNFLLSIMIFIHNDKLRCL
jgi:hypothetical protein